MEDCKLRDISLLILLAFWNFGTADSCKTRGLFTP
jgi:hypothetical protein